ncbi:ATPase, AAA family [Onchocerca flexuosa]|uniref:Mitochondrial chaperone BCS1 n=1 Tax=Onchocerca flexuosa TaxID=387005 RepID=A0A238BL90_9BILA|nr:ATPase, AAA family [Onchocerca flexuosa]
MNESLNSELLNESLQSTRFGKIYSYLSTNPYFGAGAGLAGLGICLSIARKLAVISNTLFRRRFLISLQISNEDPAYPWLLDYINRNSARQTRQISVHTLISQAESGRTVTNFTYLPGHGMHYFTYNYRWIQVERQREKQVIQKGNYRTPFETVTLTTLGIDVRFLKNLLDKATSEALQHVEFLMASFIVETGLVVYRAVGPEWRRFGTPMRKRPLTSVVLDDGVANSIVNDFQEFCSSSKWYTERGIPYRRGYLFYGPPGSGKSSFIAALASYFGYSVCMLSLSERTLDDDRLNHLLNTPPPYLGFGFKKQLSKVVNKSYIYRVTFSGLLNAIDGVASADERILFMTTNHIDRLDPALIRPGRVDVKQYFGYCTETMFSEMFKHFYGDNITEEMALRFQKAATTLNMKISPAQIQGYLLLRKEDPQASIDDIATIMHSK